MKGKESDKPDEAAQVSAQAEADGPGSEQTPTEDAAAAKHENTRPDAQDAEADNGAVPDGSEGTNQAGDEPKAKPTRDDEPKVDVASRDSGSGSSGSAEGKGSQSVDVAQAVDGVSRRAPEHSDRSAARGDDKAVPGAETKLKTVGSEKTSSDLPAEAAKQGEVAPMAPGHRAPREQVEGQRPVASGGQEQGNEAGAGGAVDGASQHSDAGQDGDPDEGASELPRRQAPAQSSTHGVGERPSPSQHASTESDPVQPVRDERSGSRATDVRMDSHRPEPDPGGQRRDGAAAEIPSPVKLAGSSVAERLAQGGSADVARGSLQARGEPDGQTNQAVVRGLNAVLRQGGGALTMKLSPASLGEVRIEMSMQGGRVSVQFDVGNVAAYEAIKGQVAELRQSLEQRGMTVERVETHVSPALAKSAQPDGQSNQRGGDQAGQSGQQDRHDAADGQSRGRAGDGDRGEHGSAWESDGPEGAEMDFEQSLRLGLDAVA